MRASTNDDRTATESNSWAMVPRDVANDDRLSPLTLAVYVYLVLENYRPDSGPDREIRLALSKISGRIKRGRDAARRALRELIAAGWIQELPTRNGQRFKRYRLTHSIHATGDDAPQAPTHSISATRPIASVQQVERPTHSIGATLTRTNVLDGFSKRVRASENGDVASHDPSDALLDALLPFTTTYPKAQQEALKFLRAFGKEAERNVINALRHPKTSSAENPIAFAFAALKKHGGILDKTPSTRSLKT